MPITVSQAIDDLKYEHGVVDSQDTKNFKNGTYGKANSSYQRLMKKSCQKAIPDSHRFAKHRQETVDLFERLMQASDKVLRITPQMDLVEGLKKRCDSSEGKISM